MRSIRIAVLMPLVWRPEKANFRRIFELLSDRFEGGVFTLSEPGQSGSWIGSFYFMAACGAGLAGKLRRLCVQTLGVLWEAARNGRFDVIIVYDPYASGAAGAFVSWILGSRLVVEMNGDYHEVEPKGSRWKQRAMAGIMDQVMHRADAIRVLNRSQELYVRAHYPSAKVFRFADFTPVDLFLASEPTYGNYFLFVGYPFRLKGVDVLINAFRLVHQEHPELRLRIMGHCPPPEDEPFRRLAEGCPNIEFIPPAWIEDVAREMRGALALVNPARTEAMGRVHIEAMASAKPVVASRTNGAREIVQPGHTGLLVNIDDVDDLANGLKWIAENREAARKMGERGRERVRELYTETMYRENVTNMIFSTLDAGRGSPVPRPPVSGA